MALQWASLRFPPEEAALTTRSSRIEPGLAVYQTHSLCGLLILEAVRTTNAKAKVLTPEAEKEEGGFGRHEFRAHFLSGECWVLPSHGPFLAGLNMHPRGWGFPPGGLHSLKSCPSQPTSKNAPCPAHPSPLQGLPSLNSLGAVRSRCCQF